MGHSNTESKLRADPNDTTLGLDALEDGSGLSDLTNTNDDTTLGEALAALGTSLPKEETTVLPTEEGNPTHPSFLRSPDLLFFCIPFGIICLFFGVVIGYVLRG